MSDTPFDKASGALPRRLEINEDTPHQALKQLGKSGVIRSLNGIPEFDPNQTDFSAFQARGLTTDHGELHRILFYDPVVFGVFSLTMVEILRAYWYARKHRNETPFERQQRELLEWVFGLEGRKAIMRGGLRTLIQHLTWARVYGFSIVELSWDAVMVDGKRRFVPVKADWRAPWTIFRWIYEGEELIGFTQLVEKNMVDDRVHNLLGYTSSGFGEIFIPIGKCLLLTNNYVSGNPEGISDFRTAFPFVRAKLDQFKRDQLAEDRLAHGLIHIREQGDDKGPWRRISQQNIVNINTCLNKIASGSSNRIVTPYGVEIEFAWPTYDRPDSTKKLQHIDRQIMLSTGATLLDLDNTRGGATGYDSLSQLTFHGIDAFADLIGCVLDGNLSMPGHGLVSKILTTNFGARRRHRPVGIEHYGIVHQDPERLANTGAKAAMMGLITPDAIDEQRFRRGARMGDSDLESIEIQRKKTELKNGQITNQGDQAGTKMPKATPQNANGDPLTGGENDEAS